MTQEDRIQQDDPLGLGDLPLLDPPDDGWLEVRSALEADRRQRRFRRFAGGLAAAACVVLVAGVMMQRADQAPVTTGPDLAATTTAAQPADVEIPEARERNVSELIAMSQLMERRLRLLRSQSASMPADAAAYQAELEDMIARVDSQLSDNPDAAELWGQRVSLLLDLESLFQHHFEREYGRMASL